MTKQSAGIALYRYKEKELQFFLVHPGGPFWKNKDEGSWSIPKGEFSDGEDPLEVAKREFNEETGHAFTFEKVEALAPIKQKGGKTVYAWAAEGDIDADTIMSNPFEIEWPPKSGKMQQFPEVDKAAWFSYEEAKRKINPSQGALIEELINKHK